MIFELESELFNRVLKVAESCHPKLHKELLTLQPKKKAYSLEDARAIKSTHKRKAIKDTIEALQAQNITPTKYQVHKRTNIAYVTLNRYYDTILDEVTHGSN
jgi:capsule polysaccharide modification protein KpsS